MTTPRTVGRSTANGVALWVGRHPLIAFNALCCAVTWALWMPALLGSSDIAEALAAIGVFAGPGIAYLLIARVAGRPAQASRPTPFWVALLIAWTACAAVYVGNQILARPDIPTPAFVVFALVAVIPAGLVATALSGAPGVRRTFSALMRPTGHRGWYVLAIGLPVALRLLSVGLARVLGWKLLTEPDPGGIWSAMLLHASVNVASQFVSATNASLLVDGAVAIAVIIAGRMWRP